MVEIIPINLVVEDDLSEVVLQKIFTESTRNYAVGTIYGKTGYGYIKQKIEAINEAAKGTPFAIIVDLEEECPPVQLREWIHRPLHPNLIFRIAVNEVESWLLADKKSFASYLNISETLIPNNADSIPSPKNFLIQLAKRSRKRLLREAIVPVDNSTARVGPDYNGQLSSFVFTNWSIKEAIKNSDSLKRAVEAINTFVPQWNN